MKKILIFLALALALSLVFTSCGDDSPDVEDGSTTEDTDININPDKGKFEEDTTSDEIIEGDNTDGDNTGEDNTEDGGSGGEGKPEHTHAFGEWVTLSTPTCTLRGKSERSCECGEKEAEYAAASHTVKDGKCTVCGLVFSVGLEFTADDDGECVLVGLGECLDGTLVIPQSSPDGSMVTSISDRAFEGCNQITSVVIPGSVTSIGASAFEGCPNLSSIVITDGVSTINSRAFFECSRLGSIVLPGSVEKIGNHAFSGCFRPNSLTIPSGVTSIGASAFSNCDGLTSISIPASLTSIGNYAFTGCARLESITVAADNASYQSIGGNLYTKDGKTLLQYAVGKESEKFTIPNSVTSIGAHAFDGGWNLKSIVIPGSVKSIGSYAFYGCWNLLSVIIPNSVTSIDDYVFANCTHLTSVLLPDSVTSIGEGAFLNTEIYNNDFYWDNDVLYIGNHLIKAKDITGYYKVNEGTLTIAASAFAGCARLVSVVIPASVTSIDKYTFSGCDELVFVTLPSSVKTIGESAFAGCENLYSLVIHNGLTSIGKGAFEDCIGMTSIVIPSTITEIGDGAFYGCANFGIVYYRGREAEWKKITIGSYNSKLTDAEVEYNYKEYEKEEETEDPEDPEGTEENT